MASVERPAEPEEVFCARHPRVETRLRCGRCETPICPKCLVSTPVGARCRSCARVKRFALAAGPADLARAAALGLAVAAVGGLVASFIPFLGLLAVAFVGFLVGEAVSVSARRRRGPELAVLAIVCLVLGFAFGPILGALLAGNLAALGVYPRLLLATLTDARALLGLGLGALLAWMRTR